MNRRWSRSRLVRILAGFGCSALLFGWVTATTSDAATTPAANSSSLPSVKTVIGEAKAAMLHEQSVRYMVNVHDAKTKDSYAIVANLGVTSGTEDLSAGKAVAHIRLTSSDGYFSGNSAGLMDFFGMPASDTSKVGAKWVDTKAGSTAYKALKTSTTMASLIGSLYPAVKATTIARSELAGKSVYVLRWKVTSSGTTSAESLYLPTSGSALPISGMGTDGTVTQMIAFSRWHESIAIVRPQVTVPFAKVS